ncbi:1-phosphofructokinase [Ammoniphilus sp. YIM 78166]|uniref:1-phosphofructokinase n=1 Tax=Ammoniphilus sp. YIM 78166 TaxID=1644106 RepID=UPI00106F562C|nr:1-phosphofructokinase [Ammoniphilus sp. YIM 78166]
MIYTLTLNPSIDYHIRLHSFSEGVINPVTEEWKDAGGKGINVSKVLNVLGMDSMALGFIGGFTGAFIQQQVETLGISHQFIAVSGDSRINVKMKAATETEFTGISPIISSEAMDQLMDQIRTLDHADFLVLAGSVPASLPPDIYQMIMHEVKGKGVRVFLDAKGKALEQSLASRPFLIKPNHHELGELFATTIETPEQAVHYGREAVNRGAQNVIVSLAGKGAVFINQEVAYVAEIPPTRPVNSIGAGDSMVAGFLYAYVKDFEIKEAFRYAVAAGSTTALSQGFCTPEKIHAFIPSITINLI